MMKYFAATAAEGRRFVTSAAAAEVEGKKNQAKTPKKNERRDVNSPPFGAHIRAKRAVSDGTNLIRNT